MVDRVFNYIDEIEEIQEEEKYLYALREDDLIAYNRKIEQLTIEICDVNKFIKLNECQEVTSPIFFNKRGIPKDDGLLSNTIFGLTKEERSSIFGYIDLHGYFIDPSCYKAWYKIDKNIRDIVHMTDTFSIDKHGYIVKDPNGKNGISFIKDNFNKIKFKKTGSIRRDLYIKYLEKNGKKMFINKYLVIPAYYRDIDTSSKGIANVGAINKLYSRLISNTIALSSTQDYGFDTTGAINGNIQETLLTIYNWFVGNNDTSIEEPGTGIAGKFGLLRMANMSKTTDYSSRLVMSSSNLKVEFTNNMMVNLDKSAIPLAAVVGDYKPFVLFNIKHFFENEFSQNTRYPCLNSKGNIEYLTVKNPLIEFSEERIEEELKRFIHGYSNRFIPIELHVEENDNIYNMIFKGRPTMNNIVVPSDTFFKRKLTWCDIIYMAAVESVKDKMILITRFPVESQYSQITTGIVVNSTIETEPLYINNTYYQYYPKIREEDIGTDTSNRFVDIAIISNLLLDGLTGDYDGDQITIKSLYTREANNELYEFNNSKANFITLGVENIKKSSGDAIMSTYSLTKVLNDTKLTNPIF